MKENNLPQNLLAAAVAARARAYAPYSNFMVGAALLGKNGVVYTGCNIENASYGASNCAERTAIFKAVEDGCRSFTAIAVVGGPNGPIRALCPPCGICRQVMAEFCPPDFMIYLWDGTDTVTMTLSELLPGAFGSDAFRK